MNERAQVQAHERAYDPRTGGPRPKKLRLAEPKGKKNSRGNGRENYHLTPQGQENSQGNLRGPRTQQHPIASRYETPPPPLQNRGANNYDTPPSQQSYYGPPNNFPNAPPPYQRLQAQSRTRLFPLPPMPEQPYHARYGFDYGNHERVAKDPYIRRRLQEASEVIEAEIVNLDD